MTTDKDKIKEVLQSDDYKAYVAWRDKAFNPPRDEHEECLYEAIPPSPLPKKRSWTVNKLYISDVNKLYIIGKPAVNEDKFE